jgi:MraZ protein
LAFLGHHEHSLDAKNRLSIPAGYRAAFASGVVLALGADPCVTAWTPDRHREIIDRSLGQLNPLTPEYGRLARYFRANAFEVELDASGRVTLRPSLLEHAGITKEVVVAGVGEHLEIWDRERWAEEQTSLVGDIPEVIGRLGHAS